MAWSQVNTAQKITFSIKGFFSKYDQISSFLQIWSHLLMKSLMENFIFCAMSVRGKCKTYNSFYVLIMTQLIVALNRIDQYRSVSISISHCVECIYLTYCWYNFMLTESLGVQKYSPFLEKHWKEGKSLKKSMKTLEIHYKNIHELFFLIVEKVLHTTDRNYPKLLTSKNFQRHLSNVFQVLKAFPTFVALKGTYF